MWAYWPYGPTALAVIGVSAVGLSLLSANSSVTLDDQPPSLPRGSPSHMTNEHLSASELDRIRGWYGLEVNAGPTQYHLTLRPLAEVIERGCLSELREGDLIKLVLSASRCQVSVESLSGRDLYALRVPLSLNEAPLSALTQIRGLGPKRAQQIIEGRPWRELREITRIRGIGAKTLKRLRRSLTTQARALLWSRVSNFQRGVRSAPNE